MKALLTRIGLPKAWGLYIENNTIHLSQVVGTPFGPVEITRQEAKAATPETVAAELERLLTRLGGRRNSSRTPVAFGLPGSRIYFSTRPIQSTASNPTPDVLLRESLRSSQVPIEAMVVDVIHARPDLRPVASIAAAEKACLQQLLDSVSELNIRLFRVEPAPCALLRTTSTLHRLNRSNKVALRLLLNDREGLAILVVNNLPIVWRSFSLVRGDESSNLLSASRSTLAVSKHSGIESDLDIVAVHGRADLQRLLDVGWLEQQLGTPLQWFDGPALGSSSVAFGLALGCLIDRQETFDLARSLRPPSSFWDKFPYREVAVQTLLIIGLALFLGHRYFALSDSYAKSQSQISQSSWFAMDQSELEMEKQELRQKVTAMRKVLDHRVRWTSFQRELADRLPPNVYLTSLHGVSELPFGGTKARQAGPQKSLILRGAVSLPEDGLVPREIDRFLEMLRANPLLKRDFPIIELTALTQSRRKNDENALALFTVVCLPKGSARTAR